LLASVVERIVLFVNILACLKKYSAVNGQLPTRIFIYRDGVGDGMLSMVEEFEVPQIEAAIKAMKTDYE